MGKRKYVASEPAPDWTESALEVARGAESIELEDARGNRITVTEAHWRRWHTALAPLFRPVADSPDPTGSIETPTGDNTKEN